MYIRFIQQNIPYLSGLLAYYIFKTILGMVLQVGFVYYLQPSSNVPLPVVFVLSMLPFVLADLFGFLLSVKWIILPLSKWDGKGNPIALKSLLTKWIVFSFLVLIFGRLPTLAFVRLLSRETADLIASMWIPIVTFLVLKAIFSRLTPPNRENTAENINSSVLKT